MIHHPHGPSAIGNPCNGAFRLSQIAPPQAANEDADEGTLLHSAVASGNMDGLDDEQQRAVEACLAEAANCRELAGPGAVAYREARIDIFRADSEIQTTRDHDDPLLSFGTLDFIAISGSTGYLRDWKFGRMAAPLAADQLACYAAGAFQRWGDLKTIHASTCQPRARQHEVSAVYHRADLPGLLERIIAKIEAREAWTVDQPLVTGEHCQHCRAALICPRRKAEIGSLQAAANHWPVETMDGATVAGLLPVAKRAEKLVALIRDRAKMLAQSGDLPGYRLVEVRGRERMDATTLDIAEGLRLAGWTPEQIWDAIEFDLGKLRAVAKAMPLPADAPPKSKPEIYHLGAVAGMIGRAPGYSKLVEENKSKEIAE
jgi:hypothetical protein